MKIKILALILIIVCLHSCGSNIPTQKDAKSPYVVISIELFDDTKLCKYNISTGTDYFYFDDNMTIIDSIGKFSISDTVYLSLNKL